MFLFPQELDKYRVNVHSEDQQRLVLQLLQQHEQYGAQQKQPQEGSSGRAPPTPPMIHAVRFRVPKEPANEQPTSSKPKSKLLIGWGSKKDKDAKEKAGTGARGREGLLSHFRWPRSRSADRLMTSSLERSPAVKPEVKQAKRRTWFFSETSV